MSDAVLADITSTWEGLSKGRKKRPLPEGLPSPEEVGDEGARERGREGGREGGRERPVALACHSITQRSLNHSPPLPPPSIPPSLLPSLPTQMGKWTATEEHALHSTSKPGVLALDVSPLEPRLLVTGGMDKEAVVFDRQVRRERGRASGQEGGREGGIFSCVYQRLTHFVVFLSFLSSFPPSLLPALPRRRRWWWIV